MKYLLLCLVAVLTSCVSNPSVTVVSPDGTKMRLSTGANLMAEVDEQVSEVEAPGYHLRHMVKRQDATRVPMSLIQALGAKWLAGIAGRSTDLATKTNGAITLKGTKDPNVIPLDPNAIPKNPNVIPFDPN